MVSREEYYSQQPFPHMVVDNFAPIDLINRAYKELIEVWPDWAYATDPNSEREQNKKEFYPYRNSNEDEKIYIKRVNDMKSVCPHVGQIFNDLTSKDFLEKLDEMTGITNLFTDPYFAGGGIHRIYTGGHLNVHTDYMLHPVEPWYRRINLLLYLTPDWQEEWGGNFEMWNEDTTEKIQDVSPVQNRCVIFNTTSKSFHGHPRPLNTPPDVQRWSVALYYFTKHAPEGEEKHNTAQWRYV